MIIADPISKWQSCKIRVYLQLQNWCFQSFKYLGKDLTLSSSLLKGHTCSWCMHKWVQKLELFLSFIQKQNNKRPNTCLQKETFFFPQTKVVRQYKADILMFGIFVCHDCSRLRSCICAFIAKPFKNGLGSKRVFLYAPLLCCSA